MRGALSKPQMVLKLDSVEDTKEPKRWECAAFVRKKLLRSRKMAKYVRPIGRWEGSCGLPLHLRTFEMKGVL